MHTHYTSELARALHRQYTTCLKIIMEPILYSHLHPQLCPQVAMSQQI